MTKLLNLDELPVSVERTIVLNGKRHEMKPMSVGEFIAQQKLAKELEGNTDAAKEFEAVIGMVNKSFPTMKREELEALSFDKLRAIFDFLSEKAEESAAAAAADQGE